MGIYEQMEKDWETYCLMSGIAFVEEMSKPKPREQPKKYKGKTFVYTCYRTLRFKMKDYNNLNIWWRITRHWERKLKLNFIGKAFKSGPKKENYSGQYYFIFSPIWLYHIIKTVGRLPSKYAFDIAMKRLDSMTWMRSGSLYLIPKEDLQKASKFSLYKKLARNKFLAAGVFVISFDLEFKGIYTAGPSLCMTTRYEDFLDFLLNAARNFTWTSNKGLSNVDINHSLVRGINATPKKEFRLSLDGAMEIYKLAGPLADQQKDLFMKFHLKRRSVKKIPNYNQKENILEILRNGSANTARNMQLLLGVRADVVLEHLKGLEKNELVNKTRDGKGYVWSIRK